MDLSGLPLTLRTVIPESYVDMMGHMNVMWYTHLFGKATGELFQLFGFTHDYFRERRAGTFALKQLFNYRAEVLGGQEVEIRSRVLGRSAKRFHTIHFMTRGDVLAATAEYLGTHVDLTIRRTSPIPPDIAEKMDRLIASHAALGWDAPVCGAIQP
jgi:acyl-CoA thioester hydrolase